LYAIFNLFPESTDVTLWENLSESQRAAACHDAGPAAVYAGPGSGKTRVVTLRAARLALEGRRLLVTTFTNDATEEMRARLAQLLPKERQPSVHVTTLHALCLQILKAAAAKFQLLTDEFTRRSLAEAAAASQLEGGVAGFLTRSSYLKNTGVTAGAYKHDGSGEDIEFARVWRAYEKAKAQKGVKEFDDLILDTVALLGSNEALRREWAARYTQVIVDECQDMNSPQYAVAFALARDHKNLMLVGDLDQSLYGFRGADAATFRHFAANPRTRVYELRENYRCTRAILAFADSLIRQDASRRVLTFVPTRPEGEPVTWERYPDADIEALAVGEQILRLRQRGAKFADMAVLYRTNAQSEAFERHFAALEIPYVLRDDGDFYSRKEVRGILAYLNFFASESVEREALSVKKAGDGSVELAGEESLNAQRSTLNAQYPDEWLLALLNIPNRKIARGVAGHLVNHAEIRGRTIWEILPEFHAPDLKTHKGLRALTAELKQIEEKIQRAPHAGEAIRIVRAVTQFDDWLRRDEQNDRDNDRIQNVQRMQAAAAHYPTMADYLAAIRRVREEQARRKAAHARKREPRDEVTLATGHAAKGLEWRVVFAVGWSEEILPHRKADNLDEERRIAYVIATRARDLLSVSSLDRWNDAVAAPSRFLTGLQLVAPVPPTEDKVETPLPEESAEEVYGGLFLA
jgi:superfamily I DNA/RNA helicase